MSSWSASLYTSDIDAVLPQLLPSFLQWARTRDPSFSLWILRYGRGGDHLKLRFRSRIAHRDEISERFERECARILAAVQRSESQRTAAETLPPIDPEDRAPGLRPNHRLVWTSYRFQPSHVGGEPLSEIEGFEQAYCQCLCEATGYVLNRLDAHANVSAAPWPTLNRRLGWAADLFIIAASELAEDGARREFWLSFRDWLLRVSPDPDGAAQGLARQAAAHAESVERLLAREHAMGEDPSLLPWRRAVRTLRDLCLQATRPEPDSLGPHPTQAHRWVMCRLIHNAVNPLHLRFGNEAYLAQLLAEAAESRTLERACA